MITKMNASDSTSKGGDGVTPPEELVHFLNVNHQNSIQNCVYTDRCVCKEITGFWVGNPGQKFTAELWHDDSLLLSRTEVFPDPEDWFINVPFFKGPFPHNRLDVSKITLRILNISYPVPCYVKYTRYEGLAKDVGPILLTNGQGTEFIVSDGIIRPKYLAQNTSSFFYQDAILNIKEIFRTRVHSEKVFLTILPVHAPLYVKALINLGFYKFSLKSSPVECKIVINPPYKD